MKKTIFVKKTAKYLVGMMKRTNFAYTKINYQVDSIRITTT